MQKYIAFLRGINVGGHNKLPMQDLRALMDLLGFLEVKTYIQTGNIVFKSDVTDIAIITSKIEAGIENSFGFKIPPVLVKTPKQVALILENYPFSETEKQTSYFALLYTKVGRNQKQLITTFSFLNEKFKLINDCVYLYSSTGYGRAKANNNFLEKKKLEITVTTRNFKTLTKLLALSEA